MYYKDLSQVSGTLKFKGRLYNLTFFSLTRGSMTVTICYLNGEM